MTVEQNIEIITKTLDVRLKAINIMLESLTVIAVGSGCAISAKKEARDCLEEVYNIFSELYAKLFTG